MAYRQKSKENLKRRILEGNENNVVKDIEHLLGVTEDTSSLINSVSDNVNYVDCATTEALPANTYSNGTGGVGATITLNANGQFPSIDGVASYKNMTVLVKDELDKRKNGVYELTTLGTVSTQAVLTRVPNYDETHEVYPSNIIILGGSLNNIIEFFQEETDVNLGTSDIIYDVLNKTRLDTAIIQGILCVDTATSAALGVAYTYTNGTISSSRPGYLATIVKNTNGAFPMVGDVAPFIGMKFLLKDEASPEYNGVYKLVNKGSATSKWKAVRSEFYSNSTISKRIVAITNSDSNLYGKIYACDVTNISDVNVGTDAIDFTEVPGAINEFIQLTDVPNAYTGEAGKAVVVNGTEDGLEFSVIADTHFANTNLTFTTNRSHDLAGYKATFDNAEIEIISDADTSGDVPFHVTRSNGTSSLYKVLGDGTHTFGTDNYTSALKLSRRIGSTTFDIDTTGATVRQNYLALSGTYQQGAIEGNNGLTFYSQGSPDAGTVSFQIDGGKIAIKPYLKAALPSATNSLGNTVAAGVILVTDATPRPTLCYSNGTNWIDIQTGVAVV